MSDALETMHEITKLSYFHRSEKLYSELLSKRMAHSLTAAVLALESYVLPNGLFMKIICQSITLHLYV